VKNVPGIRRAGICPDKIGIPLQTAPQSILIVGKRKKSFLNFLTAVIYLIFAGAWLTRKK